MNQRNEQGFPSPFESFDEKQSMLSAICIEGGLAVFALAVGWWANFPPAAKIEWSYNGFLFASVSGIFATIPMLVLYVITCRMKYEPLQKIVRLVKTFVFYFFHRCSSVQIALICALAGIGEELFFRGLLQAGIAHAIGGRTGVLLGIVISALLFGLAHCITRTYAIIAFFIGIYFSLLFYFSDSLLAVMITHGLYDYYIIRYIMRSRWKSGEKNHA